MQNSKSYYDILGVSHSATPDKIKRAYRELSLQHHPDRGGDSGKFQQLNEAYECLSDPEKKRGYDMMRNSPFMGPNQDMGINPADIIGMMFGGMPAFSGQNGFPPGFPGPGGNIRIFHNGIPTNLNGGVNGPTFNNLNKPPPINITVEIDLEHAFTGGSMPVPIKRWLQTDTTKTEESETIYVEIPKGIDNDESVILKDKGNVIVINQEIKGDVKIFFRIKNNSNFSRKGLDLIYKKTITLKESLCGFSFDLQYINGKTFKIQNTSGNIITPNFNKIIPKFGMKRENHIGNLIINFEIIFPQKLTEEQINTLKTIL